MASRFNSSVGRLNQLLLDPAGGLVIQSKTPVTENAIGGSEQTITFLIADSRFPAVVPARFAASPLHSQLARETTRYIKGGHSPGVGKLEVVYRGTFYTTPAPDVHNASGFTGMYEAPGHLGHMEITDSYSTAQIRTVLGETYTYRALSRQYHYLLDYAYVHAYLSSMLSGDKLNAPLYATSNGWTASPVSGGGSTHAVDNSPLRPLVDSDEVVWSSDHFTRVKDGTTYYYRYKWVIGDMRIVEYGALWEITEVGIARIVESLT